MAQKIHPRSLRSQKQLFGESSFFSEKNYSKVWTTNHVLMNHWIQWSQKNLNYKKKRKSKNQKRSAKNQTFPNFLKTRFSLLNRSGISQVSPILFKFAFQSFSQKYNPMKAFRKKKNFSHKKTPSKKGMSWKK